LIPINPAFSGFLAGTLGFSSGLGNNYSYNEEILALEVSQFFSHLSVSINYELFIVI